MDNETWKLLVGGVVTLCSTALGGALSFGGGWFVASRNSASNKELKEHEYALAHKTSLLKKRFEIYNEFEQVAFSLISGLIDTHTGDQYLAVFKNYDQLEAFKDKLYETKSKLIWLNEVSRSEFGNLSRATIAAIKDAHPFDNAHIRAAGMKHLQKVRELAINFITVLQLDYHTLHEIQLLAWAENPEDYHNRSDTPYTPPQS